MSGDALSDLLRAVRLRGSLFFYLEGADPWVAETPTTSRRAYAPTRMAQPPASGPTPGRPRESTFLCVPGSTC